MSFYKSFIIVSMMNNTITNEIRYSAHIMFSFGHLNLRLTADGVTERPMIIQLELCCHKSYYDIIVSLDDA